MKIKKFLIVICFFIFVCVLFISCGNNVYLLAQNCISEVRQNIYVGSSDLIFANFMSGKREKDYKIDGKNNELIDFGIICFDVSKLKDEFDKAFFEVTVDEIVYSGELEKNPFDGTYMADIKKLVNSNKINCKFIYNNNIIELELKCVSLEWNINYDEALKTTCSYYNKEIKKMIKNNTLNAEIFIKVLFDNNISEDDFYWIVRVVSNDLKMVTCVIDVFNNKVVSCNIK